MRKSPQSTKGGITALMIILLVFLGIDPYAVAETFDTYTRACDGSAAVAIGSSEFISASDEDNVLRLYRYGQSEPIQEFDKTYFLQLASKGKEVDIEGAARIDDRIYWIGSHSRDKEGHKEKDRARLFATEVKLQGDRVQIISIGVPYKKLKRDLVNLPPKYKFKEARKIAPQEPDALNIEGLAATPDGKLLLAFRNPVYEKKALIIPLENPEGVISGQPARLGLPFLLSLGGLGIRSIDYQSAKDSYLIIAGPSEGDKPDSSFKIYEWAGPGSSETTLIKELRMNYSRVQPEAVFVKHDSQAAYILSDDGELKRNPRGIRCKDLPIAERSFRGFTLAP